MAWPLRLLLALLLVPATGLGGEWSGRAGVEWRLFDASPADRRQQRGGGVALTLQPEYYHSWDDGDRSLLFVPSLRLDSEDGRRSRFDLRELAWIAVEDDHEWRIGIRKLFWGVTESQHLVDIINQTDLVDSIDGEEKLGQPMVNLALIRDWGTLDLYLLPLFRERTFAGSSGRLRPRLPVDSDSAHYAPGAGNGRLEWALRWSHAVGPFDLAISHFDGTGREPTLLPGYNQRGEPDRLIPFYEPLRQTALELQATLDATLWKLELAGRRTAGGERYAALTGGFEHTLYDPFGGSSDLGLLFEYLWDERGKEEAQFNDHLFLATRIALNDLAGSELLAGVIVDRKGGDAVASIEASRRIADDLRLTVEGRLFRPRRSGSLLSHLGADDYLQVAIEWYF